MIRCMSSVSEVEVGQREEGLREEGRGLSSSHANRIYSGFRSAGTPPYPSPCLGPCRSPGSSVREAPRRSRCAPGTPSQPTGAREGPRGCGGGAEWLPEPLPLRAPGQGPGAGGQVSARLDSRQHPPHVGPCLLPTSLPLLRLPLSPPSYLLSLSLSPVPQPAFNSFSL